MGNNILWKRFLIGDLFERSTKLAISINQKDLNVCDKTDDDHQIALISASRNGSGRVGYIENDLVDEKNVSINKITFDDQWGFTFFQQEKFVITGGHNAILEVRNPRLKEKLDENIDTYNFISLLINKVTIKSNIFGYGYKINNKLDREVILLPCITVTDKDDAVWEENGCYYTIASDYISELMSRAKELREQKTIKVYEAEKAKYEAEYLIEKKDVVWKSFLIKDLFEPTNVMMISKVKKLLDVVSEKDSEHNIAIVGASGFNNGITGWLADTQSEGKEIANVITISYDAAYSGTAFYQKDKFVTTQNFGTHGALLIKNEKLKSILNEECYNFLCKNLIKIFQKNFCYGWNFKIHGDNLLRELMLLPCLETDNKDDSVWEIDEKYYTLAKNYISYLYLVGRVNASQKLIDNYTYQY